MQNDKDREAFEAWYEENVSVVMGAELGKYHDAHAVFGEDVKDAWQAARDHYAPKLTEKEAEKLMSKAMFETPGEDEDGYREFDYMAKEAVKALKAAGMRFKEEA